MFCDIETAKRIEASERALIRAGAERVRAHRADAGTVILPFAGGLAVYADVGSPLNKVVGAGLSGELDLAEIEAAEAALLERGGAMAAEVSTLAPPALGEALTKRGYTLAGFENVLGMRLGEQPGAETTAGVGLRDLGDDAEDGAEWVQVLVDGFLAPDGSGVESHEAFDRRVLERVFEDFVGVEGFVRTLATLDGEPAGASGVRLHSGIATLCGTATLREKRRRGVQTALLRHRLSMAAREGCDVAIVTTQPGSASMSNAVRAGFSLLYSRAVLVLESAARGS